MQGAQEIDWSTVDFDDFTTWPDNYPVAAWPTQYQLHAETALVRNLCGIGIRVEEGADGTFTIVNPGHFRHPLTHGDDALEFLSAFRLACEAMQIHYVCTPRPKDELD